MFTTIHTRSKSGIDMVIYSFNGKVKFTQKSKYNPMCVNYFDPIFDGTPDECLEYIRSH